MKFALISVYDKTNIVELAKFLLKKKYQIVSSGGTYELLKKNITGNNNKKIISVENYTGSPEMLGGRVKTLHPKIHAGILAKETDNDINDLEENNINVIDLVVCNLYPFKEVIEKEHEHEDAIENIDIGGVTLIRSAFKNHKYVTVLTNPDDYQNYMDNFILKSNDSKLKSNINFALKAMEHISDYDTTITSYFNNDIQYRKFNKISELKYGCNPHQTNSMIHKIENNLPFEILNGNPGYINYMDAIQSWCLVSELYNILNIPCAASFKHTTPAGVGTSRPLKPIYNSIYDIDEDKMTPISTAFIRARTADPLSSFGDFIAIYGIVDTYTAKLIKREVSDGIIALGYTDEAYELLKTKKQGKYIILKGDSEILNNLLGKTEYRELNGIGLSQNINNAITNDNYFDNVVTNNNNITDNEKQDLIIANTTLKYTPSNSIVYACDGQVIGVGAGQQNRVDCVKLAGNKAVKWALTIHIKSLIIMKRFKKSLKRQERVNGLMQFLQFNKNTDSKIDKLLLNKWIDKFIMEEPPNVNVLNEKINNINNNNVQNINRNNFGKLSFASTTQFGGHILINNEETYNNNLKNEKINDDNYNYYKISQNNFITSEETDNFLNNFKISMASDAFFPFSDNIDYAYKYGVKNILQPGGSVADNDVINSCNDYNMYMAFSNMRVFTH